MLDVRLSVFDCQCRVITMQVLSIAHTMIDSQWKNNEDNGRVVTVLKIDVSKIFSVGGCRATIRRIFLNPSLPIMRV